MPTATFASAAADGFKLLVRQYKQPDIFSGNFWFGGNSLHTCLDYLINSKTTDAETQILPYAFDTYRSMASDTGWWRDDYSWWGNAFVLALNNRGALGYGAFTYDGLFMAMEGAAECCWRQMYADWSDLAFGVPQDNAAGSADIGGGVFNIPVTQDDGSGMQGRNCVTNEGYWLLSLGLAQRNPGHTWFSVQAKAIQNWFEQWLARPKGVPGILNPAGLILERPTGNKAAPVWYWSGDQGHVALALFRTNARTKAVDLCKLVRSNMTDGQGYLHENLDFMNHGLGQFVADYATGKGIFMKSLAEINAGASSEFDGFITRNAAVVWGTRDVTNNQFTFNWNLASGYEPPFLRVDGKTVLLCNLIMQAAGQDALNAALRVSPNAEITEIAKIESQ
jgi:hypothetical protein